MTENTKPDWLIAREDERRAKDEPMTDDALLGRLEPELDATLDALVPLIQRDQDARAARDRLRDRELGISTLEGMIAEDRDAERRLMVSDPREAVNARVRANEATAMRAEAVNQFVATKAAVERYDFDAASLEIGLLVSKREDLMHLIASKDARAYVLAADADDIKAARDRVLERSVRHTAILLEMNDPKRLAQATEAETLRKTKERHEAREEAGLRAAGASAPRKPSSNAAAVALDRMAHGGRVASPVALGMAGAAPERRP